MRILTETIRAGEFWSVDRPDDKFSGSLEIKDGGEILLEIISDRIPFADIEETSVGRIVGMLEQEGPVTLEGGFFMEKSIPFGIPTKSRIRIYNALIGASCDDKSEILFSKLSFQVDLLDEWLRITGIKVAYGENRRTATITYTPIESILTTLSTGERVDISFRYTIPGSISITEAKITHKALINIHSNTPQNLSHFITIASKFTNFLSFSIGQVISIYNVEGVVAKECTGDGKEFPVHVYYASHPFTHATPKSSWREMLFTYKDIEHRLEGALRRWFDLYENISPALGLYFSSKTDAYKYIESKFLSLAQCVETLSRRTNDSILMAEQEFSNLRDGLLEACPTEHRKWLEGRLMYGNEISLSKRIQTLIAPFAAKMGDPKEVKYFVRKIIDTRNYLTHYDTSKKKSAATGTQLYNLSQKLEAVFELNILHLLGFSLAEIDEVCKAPRPLKRKVTVELISGTKS